jgi:hypothetical protein
VLPVTEDELTLRCYTGLLGFRLRDSMRIATGPPEVFDTLLVWPGHADWMQRRPAHRRTAAKCVRQPSWQQL